MGVLGGVFVLKSGLRILIRAPEVPFSVPPKTPKMTHLGPHPIGHGCDSKLYHWMIYLKLSRWPLVWPIGSWRAGSGTTLSPSSRWNYFSFFFSIFFKVGLWEGEWLLLAWHLLSPHACCRLLLGRSRNTEFIIQDRLSLVSNWSEWAAHPLSI